MGFSEQIIGWYEVHHRKLPWRDTNDPYLIWVSEVILQQTRVDQGLNYYLRFTDRFPDIATLAAASEDEVLKTWQGLGYYSRARNMHHAAKEIQLRHNGIFPSDFNEILALKGIGDYSASAVASFAFSQPYPVMDGNVIRLVSRYFGIQETISSSKTRRKIKEILSREMDHGRPGLFNQAIMEFGAMGCTPYKPFCRSCPLAEDCFAFRNGIVDKIPVKEKKPPFRQRFFNYIVFRLRQDNQVFTALVKRSGNDIWKNLYEFPMIETDKLTDWDELRASPGWALFNTAGTIRLAGMSGVIKHTLTHRKLIARYFTVSCESFPEGFLKVPLSELNGYPVHVLMDKIISGSNITFTGFE